MSNIWDRERLLRSTVLAGFAAAGLSFSPVYAQEDTVQTIPDQEEDAQSTDENEADDRVIITGSRIQRSTFTSIAPLQVIDGDISREAGLIDAASILQDSTASSGVQIDATFQGFVLDNGPGASTVDLRGLGASRTLTLINGRRLAPAGVEGAPTSPDLTLIPSSLVDRYDLLLDGASSVYGSDAVAGVVNVILRRDFDGLEASMFYGAPEHGGAEEVQGSLTWGVTGDRGFAGFALEYNRRERMALADRDWSAECDRHFEVTESGEVRNTDLYYSETFGMSPTACKASALAGRMFIYNNDYGSVYFDPTGGNSGVPNFSESVFLSIGVDANGDGVADVDYADYTLNGRDREADMLAGVEQLSFYSFGEYETEVLGNATVYYEASYSEREVNADAGPGQFFPDVPAENPFNPCGDYGIDCGLAVGTLTNDPEYIAAFQAYYNGGPGSSNCFGLPASLCTPASFGYGAIPTGPVAVQPIVSVRGDRSGVESNVSQMRLISGLRGDIVAGWTYDVSASYTRSHGTSVRRGIRDDRLQLSLATTVVDPTSPSGYSCGVVNNVVVDPNCVPINMFAPSLYNPIVGDFATQEEHDYLFGVRSFETVYEQSVFNANVAGELFQLPAGPIGAAFGVEYRLDEIDSRPDDVARDGLFFGFFSDGGATGSKDLYEAYGEVEIPIFAGAPLAEELTVNLSTRWTEEQYYGAAWTYSGKVAYRPIDWLLFRGTYGTSFRAPNLREQFLAGQTGFLTLSDPCAVPEDAWNALTSTYDPAADNRDQITLDNCTAAGIDPTSHLAGQNGSYSMEIQSGGALDLREETSTSWSAGFVLEQPWFDAFDLTFSVTYWDMLVEDSIAEPSSGYIINDCYTLKPNLSSAFCSRITRDPSNDNRISLVDAAFININEDTASGIDFNILYQQDVNFRDRLFQLTADISATKMEERGILLIDETGAEDFDNDVGEFGSPEWNARARFSVEMDDWRLTWTTRYLSSVSTDDIYIDDFDDITGGSDTCLGPSGGDELCRDIGWADDYFLHGLSLSYTQDDWGASFGVRNLFDEEPPMVDSNEVLTNGGNAPIGAGYDIIGRTFYASVRKSF